MVDQSSGEWQGPYEEKVTPGVWTRGDSCVRSVSGRPTERRRRRETTDNYVGLQDYRDG